MAQYNTGDNTQSSLINSEIKVIKERYRPINGRGVFFSFRWCDRINTADGFKPVVRSPKSLWSSDFAVISPLENLCHKIKAAP